MEPRTARLGILLKLRPQELEEQFWNAAETQRMLSIMDILAFCMVLPNMVAAVLGRVNKSLPEHVQLPWGAKAILMLYWAVTMLPVAVMLLHLQSYTKWRLKLAVLGRLYRLVSELSNHFGSCRQSRTQLLHQLHPEKHHRTVLRPTCTLPWFVDCTAKCRH